MSPKATEGEVLRSLCEFPLRPSAASPFRGRIWGRRRRHKQDKLEGKVIQVPPDAIVDEKRDLAFPARAKRLSTRLKVDEHQVVLSAGMSASVKIVTGRRRVIDFLGSPVAKAVGEAGRER